jgi:membrane protein CcdC involved in cytochrome C biogenesis
VGTMLGLIIGRFMEVKTSDKDDKIILKGSRVAVAIWIVIILLKIYGESVLNNTGIIKVDLVLALFLMITLGTVVSRRIIIYWKYLKHKKTIES